LSVIWVVVSGTELSKSNGGQVQVMRTNVEEKAIHGKIVVNARLTSGVTNDQTRKICG
jgi:hypothetical protein